MPFTSKVQERAAFGGYLGAAMKRKAKEWADETNQKSLPEKVTKKVKLKIKKK
jgi:hypothetical protein